MLLNSLMNMSSLFMWLAQFLILETPFNGTLTDLLTNGSIPSCWKPLNNWVDVFLPPPN